jgi:integrase
MGQVTRSPSNYPSVWIMRGRAIRFRLSGISPTRPRAPNGQLTVEQFMARWLGHVASTRRPTTYQSYEGMVRRYVLPVIGQVALTDLRREHVDSVLALAKDRLAPNTARLLRAILGIALNRAEKWEIPGARNVVRLTDPPRVEARELKFFQAVEARRFLQAAIGDRLQIVYVLALFCGLRRGEILALRWRDVDLDKRELHISQTLHEGKGGEFRLGEPKSKSARRSVAMAATVTSALRAHHLRQVRERLAAGAALDSLTDGHLLVTSMSGKALSKSTLRGNFRRILRKAGLPLLRIHDLRHSCASLLLGEGVAAQTVATFLGHSEVKTTLNIYGHVARAQSRDAAAALDVLLGQDLALQQAFDWLTMPGF